MRISDWSSDVCSSDLHQQHEQEAEIGRADRDLAQAQRVDQQRVQRAQQDHAAGADQQQVVGQQQGFARGRGDRKSVVEGKSVSVRVDLGGRRTLKKKNKKKQKEQSTNITKNKN